MALGSGSGSGNTDGSGSKGGGASGAHLGFVPSHVFSTCNGVSHVHSEFHPQLIFSGNVLTSIPRDMFHQCPRQNPLHVFNYA